MNENIFDKLDFGPLKPLLDDDDITDISFCNRGQIWVRSFASSPLQFHTLAYEVIISHQDIKHNERLCAQTEKT